LYVARFANYGATYGALAGVIVLMLWFYLTAFVLLCAAELVAFVAGPGTQRAADATRK
jgi:membrane protein